MQILIFLISIKQFNVFYIITIHKTYMPLIDIINNTKNIMNIELLDCVRGQINNTL